MNTNEKGDSPNTDANKPSTSTQALSSSTEEEKLKQTLKLEKLKDAINKIKLESAALGLNTYGTQQPKTREDALEKKFEFWDTQPVLKLTETEPTNEENEPIHPPMDPNKISKDSLNLPQGFIWVSVNIDQDESEVRLLKTFITLK